MNKKTLITFVLAMGFLGNISLYSKTYTNNPSIVVDQRVELLSLIFRLAGNPEYNRCLIPGYNEEVNKTFSKYRNHPVVEIARKLRENNGISYDAVMSLAVHITEPGELKMRVPLTPFPIFLDKRWSNVNIENFLDSANSFVQESKFISFFDQNRWLYNKAISKLSDYLNQQGHFKWFDSFFGTKPGAHFKIILGMLNGGSSYGVRITLPHDDQELYSVLGIWSVNSKGIPEFQFSKSNFDVIPTIIHEFCHSYINPLVNYYEKQFETAGKEIFSYVFADMKRQAYGSWKILIYESIVRACVIRYTLRNSGPTEARELIKNDIKKKFIWMEALNDLLGEYENNRDQYPVFKNFFPRFVTFFKSYAADNQAKLASLNNVKKNPWQLIKMHAPQILSMIPANGAVDIDPNLKEMTFVFDMPMKDHSWSFMRINENFPDLIGSPHYNIERKILKVSVKLKPGKNYEFGLNNENYLGFKNEHGVPLIPLIVRFTTRK